MRVNSISTFLIIIGTGDNGDLQAADGVDFIIIYLWKDNLFGQT